MQQQECSIKQVNEGGFFYGCKTDHVGDLFRDHDRSRSDVQEACFQCYRICTWRKECGTVAHSLCLWYFLFFSSSIRWIWLTVWMEIWTGIYLDRTWECFSWKSSGLGGAWTKDKDHAPTNLQAATMPDFFGKRFDSHALRIAASAIVFIFLIPYTASLYNGLSRLFGMAFDIPYSVCVILMATLTGIYVILGGYMATAHQ